MAPSKYERPDQGKIVSRLAAEFELTLDEVTALYDCECATLAIGAHVTKFLHIFAIRHVQEALQKQRLLGADLLTVSHTSPPVLPELPTNLTTRPPISPLPIASISVLSVADKLLTP